MGDGLSAQEVRAFAGLFRDAASARHVLDLAGFPAHLHPSNAQNWLLFWASVSRSLSDGAMLGGRGRLLAAARTLYPESAVFAAGPVVGPGDGVPAGPVAWNVPARLARFVGRDELLADVHRALSWAARVALVALDGLGGVGKTAVAVEYAYRYADSFDVVWWVPSERVELVGQQLAVLAGPLGLPAGSDADTVWSALRSVRSWLVVFDNVDDVGVVARFQPSAGGRVLVTSRRRAVRGLGASVPVAPFDRAASVDLLTGRVPGIGATAAGRVAAMLGDLPLGVDQAAGFLVETATPVDEYARLLATRSGDMLGRGRLEHRPDTSVATVWRVSVDRLGTDCPAAVELLELCAFCDAEPVPLGLFTAGPGRLGDGPLSVAVADEVVWVDTVGALVGFSLARRDRDMLVVHRLVAATTRHAMPPERAAERLAVVAGALRATLPGEIVGSPAGWPVWRALLPHVLAVAERARSGSGVIFDDGCWLADRAATYLAEHGQLGAAISLHVRTLTDRERVLGDDHPDTLLSRNNLALAYQAAGRVAEAINLHERTLTDRERVLGDDHPDTVAVRRALADIESGDL